MKKNNLLVLSILCGLTTSLVGCDNSSTSSSNNQSKPSNSTSNEVCEVTEDNKVHLVLLAGQSGARGKAKTSDLSDEEKLENFDVDIVADGLMMEGLKNIPETIKDNLSIDPVKGGYGDTSSEFGPELGIAQTLASRYPKGNENRKSVIVKYTACGSTFISDWYTKSLANDTKYAETIDDSQGRYDEDDNLWGPLTYNFFQLIEWTKAELAAEGYEVVIDGAAFIHGEQDTKYDENMGIYEAALEYFVKDVRDYLKDDDMPFVITEALTNSGKYCNDLKAMQRRVAAKFENCSFVTNEGLTSNTFEPWHFGKESNFEIGNRIASELVAYNDTRKVLSFEDKTIKVPVGAEVTLPKYAVANFDNDYTGYTKVQYLDSYDKNTKGEYKVKFEATGCQDVTGVLNVQVTDEVYVDGIMNEYEGRKAIELGDLGKIYVTKGEEGFYISAAINDKEVWTDGESWNSGDMGQNGENDDLRIYVTTGSASERASFLLSSANLLRLYIDGVTLEDKGLPLSNQINTKSVEGYYYRVVTKGIVNDSEIESGGVDFELYFPYDQLNYEADDLKLCFNYNDISKVDGKKVATNNYYTAEGYSNGTNLETLDSSYISINDLI